MLLAHFKENRPDGCWSEDTTAADVGVGQKMSEYLAVDVVNYLPGQFIDSSLLRVTPNSRSATSSYSTLRVIAFSSL